MQNQPPPDDKPWTILSVIKWTAAHFKAHRIDSPRLTAEILLAHTLGIARIDLYLRFDQPLAEDELARYKALIRRRMNREPVAYITGEKEFFGLDLNVSDRVLVPRPETEFLVETALQHLPDIHSGIKRILDVGTGSGAIIIALAVNRPGHSYFALDRSMEALSVAAKNALRHPAADRIGFFAGDLLEAAGSDRFDMIVSNPPYIPVAVIEGLEPEVSRFEPRQALNGGADGLFHIRRIIDAAPHCLRKGGRLLMEIGYDQRDAVTKIAEKAESFTEAAFVQDYSGHDRVLVLKKIEGVQAEG